MSYAFVHNIDEALRAVREGLEFPILIIPVPENCSRPWFVAHDADEFERMVEEALANSSFCVKPSAHVISVVSGGGYGGDYGAHWDKVSIIDDPEVY